MKFNSAKACRRRVSNHRFTFRSQSFLLLAAWPINGWRTSSLRARRARNRELTQRETRGCSAYSFTSVRLFIFRFVPQGRAHPPDHVSRRLTTKRRCCCCCCLSRVPAEDGEKTFDDLPSPPAAAHLHVYRNPVSAGVAFSQRCVTAVIAYTKWIIANLKI